MSSLSMYQELRGVKSYLLTRKEYAVLARAAAQKVIKQYIHERNQARAELDAWCKANPEPDPKKFGYSRINWWPSAKAQDQYLDASDDYRDKWGHHYQKVYYLARAIEHLESTIVLADMIEDGRYETACLERNFFSHFGGVNNVLMNHGQDVFNALYQHIEVPEHVLAEWPVGVAQVREELARRAAWDKANPEYAKL